MTLDLPGILDRHLNWRRGVRGGERVDLVRANLAGANLVRAILAGANLDGANLAGANLVRANLAGANLAGAIGNMREVVSAQVETWPITAARMLDGSVVMQIGCQRHPLEMWRKADPRWIAAMDQKAPEWWAKWGSFALTIGEAAKARQEIAAA